MFHYSNKNKLRYTKIETTQVYVEPIKALLRWAITLGEQETDISGKWVSDRG